MTMVTRVACCKLLLVSNGTVVRSHNHPDTDCSAVSAIASLLLDQTVTHAYIAGTKLYDCLGELNALMQHSVPGWRMRIANRRRHAYTHNGQARVVGRFFVDYFCIDEKRGKKRVPRRRFDVMNLDLLFDRPPEDPDVQMEMALSILELCEKRGVALRNTKGAIGSAMLKKSPQWEKGRRSAPKFVNDEARKYLPGNFYSLSNKVNTEDNRFSFPHCYYIDQSSAHHNIAASTPVPHPHSLRARGYYKHVLKGEPKRWCYPDSPTAQEILGGKQIGLVCCHILIGVIGPSIAHLYPTWAQKRGMRNVWLWTPELRLLQGDHRLQLESFSCGFTGTLHDPVLPEYASFSLQELAENPQRAIYKKGALLAAYGMLAFNGENRHIYRYWGGENTRYKVDIPIAGNVGESRITIPSHVELSTVNVIARGMIESETRTRSIEYARELHYQGFHVPQIYADGILVETDQLPFIPDGWRVAHSLTHVHIPRSNAIVSDQLVKLPGVMGTESDREWERMRDKARQPLIICSNGSTPQETRTPVLV